MTEHIQHIEQLQRDPDYTTVQTSEDIRSSDTRSASGDSRLIAARVVGYIAGILLSLLAIRFVLALLGANPSNAFANFIYSVTYPIVRPFVSLFSYNLRYSVSHFELYTLVAMLVYALLAYGITRLIMLPSSDLES